MAESARFKSFYYNYGGLEMSRISYTLSGVSSIETRHSFAIAEWQSVNYDKLCMIYKLVIRGLQEVILGTGLPRQGKDDHKNLRF
jgi:hypothetical protein